MASSPQQTRPYGLVDKNTEKVKHFEMLLLMDGTMLTVYPDLSVVSTVLSIVPSQAG